MHAEQIPVFDHEAMLRAAAARRAATVEGAKQAGRFIGTSLGAWLARAQDADVPAVGAKLIAAVPRAAFLEAMENGTFEVDDRMASLRRGLSELQPTEMARFDPCAGLELKKAMADGTPPSLAQRQDLTAFDLRAFDIIAEYPADIVPVWARPWVEAKVIDGYPVEYRVFVENGEIKGVASYYPQRPLPQTPAVLDQVEQCKQMTTRILHYLTLTGELPWQPAIEEGFAPGLAHATLDFLVTVTGEVLFLEAGPPFGAGAHPCAFIDREVSGVALALAEGVRLR